MADLSKTYGKNQFFKDDELFDKITALTYPEINDLLSATWQVRSHCPIPKSLIK